MQETVNQETPNETANEQTKQEKLFTQEEVNGFFSKRYSELMSQLNEFKTKAEKFDALEEANKSELQKATEKAEKLQSELNSLRKAEELRNVRDRVSTETGVPASLLSGEDEETCKAQALAIKDFASMGNAYPQVKDGGEVTNIAKATPRDAFIAFAAEQNN